MRDRLRRRFIIALICSLALHGAVMSVWPHFVLRFDIPNHTEIVSIHTAKVRQWVVPTPSPIPTPPNFWKNLDRSKIRNIRLTPADEQIVVLAARTRSGKPSRAPHIMRVEIRPGVVHSHSVMHIRVLAAPDANGVYARFVVWEIGVPPVRSVRLPASDPDYPGQRAELFERDYAIPWIPPWRRNRTYQVEVIATGREGIASGAFVPVRVL